MGRRGKSPSPRRGAVDFDDPDWIDQFGIGERDEATGLYEGYDIPQEVRDQLDAIEGRSQGLTWPQLLDKWVLIESDLQEHGVDVCSGVLDQRDGRWLRVRIVGLLHADTRLARAFAPEPGEQVNR